MSNQTNQTQVPEGYMKNDKGYLVPLDKVKPIDLLRDEVVKGIVKAGKELNEQMTEVKIKMFDNFRDFVELSASEYDVQWGGKKGNVTLASYDGSQRVQIAISEKIVFDERLQVAKELIDQCLHEWSDGSNDNLKVLINDAFQVDKEGKISTGRVLGLRRHNFDNEKWVKAMQAIADAITIVDTKEYIRVYQRDNDGKYQQISLDFASL